MDSLRVKYLQTLRNVIANSNKDFELVVGAKTYNMRYEVICGARIRFFVKQQVIGDDDLIIPSLVLNIGALLLPDAMHVDGSAANPFQELPDPETYKTLGSKDISESELKNIENKLKSVDIRKLLKV